MQAQCVESYRRLKNLKLVGEELGIAWQSVYLVLRSAGEPVTGDKTRYGSSTDRFAAKAEKIFSSLVPSAENQNEKKFQAKSDFVIGDIRVDVKAARHLRDRWAFSLKKQQLDADFFVCFAFNEDDSYRLLLIPGDVCRAMKTISVSSKTMSKWWDYEVSANDLVAFFESLAVSNLHPRCSG